MCQRFKNNLAEIFDQKDSSFKSEKENIEIIIANPFNFIRVKNQTEAVCIEAVKHYGFLLQYVKKQTEAICLCAVQKNGLALKYVRHQTEAICIEAVKQNGCALQYVHNQTNAICIEAVKKDGLALQYVHNQTNAICREAVKQTPSLLVMNYIRHLTEDLFLDMLKYHIPSDQIMEDLLKKIEYPSLSMIDEILTINKSFADDFDKIYVSELVGNHEKYNIAMDNIGQHVNDLLYRPNNICGLLFGGCPKLLFLIL